MKPMNTRQLFNLIVSTMKELSDHEIGIDEALAMHKLANDANILLNTEIKRAALMISSSFREQCRTIEMLKE